jgi:hypothetical protein
MLRKHVAMGAVLALGLGNQALAAEPEGFSYNNIEVSYLKTEFDDADVDGNGFAVAGSLELGSNVFATASLNDNDYDEGISSSALSLGFGFNWGLTPNLDLVSGVSYERFKVKLSGVGSASDSGFGLNAGLRGRIGALELSGGLKYVDYGDGSDGTALTAGGRYYFTPNFAAGIDVLDDDSGTQWGIALRYDFGNRH